METIAAAVAVPELNQPPAPERLPLSTKLLYGAPNFGGLAMMLPILLNMPKFYADVVGVPLGYMAIALAASRSLDAICDPLIGWITDSTHTRWGRRRPYIFGAAPFAAVAFWALMAPPAHMTGSLAAAWFGATCLLCFLFISIVIGPHHALGVELTLDYKERSSLFGVRESFGLLGMIIAAAAPGLLMQGFGWNERQVFSRIGIAFAAAMVGTCWLMVRFIHERPDFVARASNPLVPGVRRAFRNRPFRILLACNIIAGISGAIPPTMLPFFNAYVVQPAQPMLWLSLLMLAFFGVGFAFIPIWVLIARRFGKATTWIATYFIWIPASILEFLLVGKGDSKLLLILMIWIAIPWGVYAFLPPAMQADVIDYDELYTGRRREAQYGALWVILPKLVAIPGAAIPIAILASLGYVPNAMQNPDVILAIRVILTLVPVATGIATMIIVWRFPITEVNHRAMLEGIECHRRGQNAIDPLTGREIPPPSGGGADEETKWFLDNFSARELQRYLTAGAQSPPRDVQRAALWWIAICLTAAWSAVHTIGSLNTNPGALASLSVVVSGFALALFLFQVARLRAARRLASGVIPAQAIRDHLADNRQGRI